MPCGIIFLYLFIAIMLLVDVATIHYVLARRAHRGESPLQSIIAAIKRLPKIVLWVLFLSPLCFVILNQQIQVALLIAPGIMVATFFVPAMIAEQPASMIDTSIAALQALKHHFAKVLIFLAAFVLTIFVIRLGIVRYAYSSVAGTALWLLLLALVTVRDIFAGMLVHPTSKA